MAESQHILPKAKKKSRNGSILFRGMKVIIRRLELKGMNIRVCFWRLDWDGERKVERLLLFIVNSSVLCDFSFYHMDAFL